MIMSKDEIIVRYRQAKEPKKQIGILAELNQCTTEQIRKIISGSVAEAQEGKSVGHRLPQKMIEQIKAEVLAGTPYQTIADTVGVSTKTVKKYAQEVKPAEEKPKKEGGDLNASAELMIKLLDRLGRLRVIDEQGKSSRVGSIQMDMTDEGKINVTLNIKEAKYEN